MIGDIVGEVVGGTLRLVGHFLGEIVFEILIKGAGYLLCRPFTRGRLDEDSGIVVIVGIAFWIAVGAGIYAIKRQLWPG